MTKKRIAHRVDGGRLDTASGYTMKASPAPANTSPHYSNIYSDGLHTDSRNTIRDCSTVPANSHSVTDRNRHEGMHCIGSVYERWVKGHTERETETDRQTDRQTDRDRDRQTDRGESEIPIDGINFTSQQFKY